MQKNHMARKLHKMAKAKVTKAKTNRRLKKKGTKEVVLAEKICVNALKDAEFTFLPYLKEDLNGVETLTLTHLKSEGVTCSNSALTNFGCTGNGIMIIATINYDK